jgi:diadenosine tetraphosphate (Ap4A) HIT family hydrolase
VRYDRGGRVPVSGGLIAETSTWRAEHCIGPFGVGAVVVKAKEHRESLWELEPLEAAELGPFLQLMSRAIVDGLGAERAYLTMWVDKPPLHVHLVLYPRWPTDEKRGWDLDRERWAAGPPSAEDMETAAERLRVYLSGHP